MILKKSLSICIAFVLALSVPVISVQAEAVVPEPVFSGEKLQSFFGYAPDEEVSFIVEVEGDPVLASLEAAQYGTGFLTAHSADEKEQAVLKAQEEVISAIDGGIDSKLKLVSSYTLLFNGFSVKTSYGNIDEIKNIPGVKNVYVAEEIKFTPHLTSSAEMIGVLSEDTQSYSGENQLVAVIDTEFNTGHEFFSQDPLNPRYTKSDIEEFVSSAELNAASSAENLYKNLKIPFAYDYCGKDYDTYSTGSSHGTHVAGIIGGKNGSYNGSTINGVAPDCQLLLMKVADDAGSISVDAMMLAMEDAVRLGADVVNCSIGADYYSPDYISVMETCFANAYNAGVFIAVSAGNMARGFHKTVPLTENIDYSSIGSPAAFSEVMSVASVNKSSSGERAISSFSSYGVSDNLELKPEITAPGGSIISSVRNSSSSYESKNGTSMASPHIAGAVSVIYEYLDAVNPSLSGKERIIFTENLMMSTADVVYKSSTNVPYSPRVQGAGVVNVASAVKTPVILTSAGGKAKLSLGDGLSDSINIEFTVKNTGSSSVTYDKISLSVLTDGYTSKNGKTYVSDSKFLSVISHTLPQSLTISAGSDAKISASIQLDSAELEELSKIFVNGFFIDGFVRLEKEDASLPGVGIPFTGFYGDWTKATVFDSTVYDEGGSTLVNKTEAVYSTLLFTKIKGTPTVLGGDGAGGCSSKYIALSPDSDGVHDELDIQLTPMRTLKGIKSEIYDSSGTVKSSVSADILLNKFYTRTLGLNNLTNLPDGDYTLKLTSSLNYEKANATKHALEIPFYIDRVSPEIIKAVPKDGTVDVTFRDNKNLSYVYTYYSDDSGTVHRDVKEIPTPVEGETVTISFDLAEIGAENASYEDIYVFVHDCAENTYSNTLSALTGNIHPLLSDFVYESGILSASFDFVSYAESQNCTLVLAFYSSDGSLVYVKADENIDVYNGSTHTFRDFADLSRAASCRLFILDDIKNITPADTSKAFNVSAKLGN